MSFAQEPAQGRVRVLGDVMAQQVVTKVAPSYPAGAREQGISGEVELYAAVGKDGAVEQVELVHGPSALGTAAADAVKQWRFRPYLVNGQPVEVDTTVWVDFSPSGQLGGTALLPVAVSPQENPAPVSIAATAHNAPGGIDWEYDRRLGRESSGTPATLAATAQAPVASASATRESLAPAASASPPPQPAPTMAKEVVPAVAAGTPEAAVPTPGNGIPSIAPQPFAAPDHPAIKPSTADEMTAGAAGATVPAHMPYISAPAQPEMADAMVPPAVGPAASPQPMASLAPAPPMASVSPAASSAAVEPGMGIVASDGPAGITEWKLVRKVQPAYPAAAAAAGIEGVVVVDGTVMKDGTLHNLRAISGPPELQQAAVDAAAQYVYEPVLTGSRISEAPAQVAVDFLLTGPAVVAPEVMAGRLMESFTPDYPPEALRAGVSGYVTLHALIGREGQVKSVDVVSGPEQLRATALAAVKQWKWLPYKRNGVDVDVETDVVVHFVIPPA